MSQSAAVAERTLVGNRWVLVGGVGYLLEWVAIIWVGALGVGETVVRGASVADLKDAYVDHVDALTTMAGWFSLVLLFRILLFIGLRQALADSGYRHPLMDFAVAAAAVSVTLEVASYGLGAAAGGLAEDGDEAGMVALDQAAAGINLMLAGGLGVAIVCSAYCMWRAGLFPMVLNVIGAVAGVAIIGVQLTIAPATQTLFDILFAFPALFWVWMLWAGVLCWRRTPRPPGVGSLDGSAPSHG
jgi:hypothetical protein